MSTYQDIIRGIDQLMTQEIPLLLSLSEEQVSQKRNRQNRTVKMLVGHLIDSASNNHQRMVRLQYAPRCGHSMPHTEMGMLVFPDYTQDNDLWLQLQDYQHEDWQALVLLLQYYNRHICHLIRAVDTTKCENYWIDYEGNRITLNDMIKNYLTHLQLHFRQIHELL
ncbi:MAG: DinB family protein [Paludibacteraceae bacterium]